MALKSGDFLTIEQVNISEARAHLSELVQRAAAGEEIIIAKAGVPQVKLVPAQPPDSRPKDTLAHLLSEEELDSLVNTVLETVDEEETWPEFDGIVNLSVEE